MEKENYAVVCSVIVSIISVIMGYDTGVMSGALLFIKEELGINDIQVQLLNGVPNVCAVAGCLTAGRVSDYIGRRYTITLTASIFFAGSVLMGLAADFAMLLAGRCVPGVGVGAALMIAPVYTVELSSTPTRGSLATLPVVAISFGILLGYVASYFFAKLPLACGWRAMLGFGALPSAVLMFAVLAMPESPRWLVMNGRVEEALVVLRRLCSTAEEADVLWGNAAPTPERGGRGVWKEMFVRPTPPVRRVLVAALGTHFCQHLTGIEAVVLYSPRIFNAAGITTRDELLGMTIGVGATKLLFVVIAFLLVDRVDRRPLYLSSLAGAVASLACLGAGLTVIERSQTPRAPLWAVVLAVAMVFTFVASISVGVGPLTWAYSTEVYPVRLRAQGAAVGVAINRIVNGTVSMTFVSLYQAITIGGACFLFAGLAVLVAIFFYFFCPETQGQPLENIEELFVHGWRARRRLPELLPGERPVLRARRGHH